MNPINLLLHTGHATEPTTLQKALEILEPVIRMGPTIPIPYELFAF